MKAKIKLIPFELIHKEGLKIEGQKVVYEHTGMFKVRLGQYGVGTIYAVNADGTLNLSPLEDDNSKTKISELQSMVCEYRSGDTPCAGEDRERVYDIPLDYDYYEKALKLVGKEVNITLMDTHGIRNDNNNPESSVAQIIPSEYNWDAIFLEFYGKDYFRNQNDKKEFFVWLSKNFHPPVKK